METIHVGLYGGKSIFGGKETPLEANVISCDKHDSCSFFKNGHCLKVRSFGGVGCEFGTVNNIRGYTSRAKKYGEFKRKWDSHEKRGKLSYPPTKLGLIDNYVVFPYPYIRIEESETGQLQIKDPSFGNGKTFIESSKFTNDFIYRICTFRPQAMMGGTITTYQKETVPLILAHLKEVLPERYESFINAYPQFGEKEINYVGRKALLSTIKPSLVHYKSKNYTQFNEKWYWDGEYLFYEYGYIKDIRIVKNYEIVELKIKPDENAEVTISNNDQVTNETIFLD